MAADISLRRASEGPPWAYDVTITEGNGATVHKVTLRQATLERAAADATPDEVLEGSIRYLLDHEPKEAILGTFDVAEIARYFPAYWDEVGAYVARVRDRAGSR